MMTKRRTAFYIDSENVSQLSFSYGEINVVLLR